MVGASKEGKALRRASQTQAVLTLQSFPLYVLQNECPHDEMQGFANVS